MKKMLEKKNQDVWNTCKTFELEQSVVLSGKFARIQSLQGGHSACQTEKSGIVLKFG